MCLMVIQYKGADMIKCCKDCTERSVEPNCHDTCERYLAEKARDADIKKKKQLDSEYNTCARELARERKLKWQKRK